MTSNIDRLRGRILLDSDFTSDITNVIADQHSPSLSTLEFGLDFLLNHFQGDLFPRTISTKATKGAQILVLSKEEALAKFKAANYLDCRINAYPKFIDWNGINMQAPNLLFIDLDLGRFKSRISLDICLNKTLKNISQKFNVAVYPTILWSGHGYHIYLPVEAFVLERESEFDRFGYPSRKFLQFTESDLSNNKSDPEHTKGLSFKNAMLRIPGSFNSKNGNREEVEIMQKWDGNRPSIKPLLFRFDLYLLISKSKELKHKHNKQKSIEPRVFSTDWRKKHDD